MTNKAAKDKKKNDSHNRTKMLIFLTTLISFLLLIVLFISNICILPSNAVLKKVIIIIFIFPIVSQAFLFIVLKRFFASVDLVNSHAKKLSNGELNISDILIKRMKGLETLTIAFNDMKSNLLSFIDMTKTNVIILSDSIDKVSKSLEMSCSGNEQITINICHVAEKAQEQLNLVKETIADIELVNNRIENITNSISNIEKFIEKTVTTTASETENMVSFYGQMNTISDNLNNTYDFIKELNNEIEEISKIGEFIIGISNQLRLLGLNASIESGKAGEFGKGFSVVAQEINKLSSATKEGITRIKTVVENIVKSSENVSESIVSCVDNFNVSKEIFQTIKESFNNISAQGTVLNRDMKEIYDEVNLINASSKNINNKGMELYNTSNEISTKTEEIAAVTEEELAEIEEISGNTTSLKIMLNSIQNLLKRFNTSVLPVDEKSLKPIKIAVICPIDNPFWEGVRQGAMYAQKELSEKGADMEFVGLSCGESTLVINAYNKCVDEGYNGISVVGFVEDLVPVVNKAAEKEIQTIIFNCELSEKARTLAYYGPDVFGAGVLAGDLMSKALEGKGNVAIIRGSLDNSSHRDRRNGIIKSLKTNKKIRIVEEIEIGTDKEGDIYKYNATKDLLIGAKNITGIFITGGGALGSAKAIEELGFAGRVKIICFDYDKEIFEYIKKGITYSAIGQDPFGQGHDPAIYLYNYLVTGEKPDKKIPTRFDVVDSNNVNQLF